MKVLFINSVYGRGSTGRIVQQLGKALEERGDSYMVAYGRGEKLNDPHCYYIGSPLDVYVHAGLSRATDRTGFYSKAATRKLLGFIRSYEPDVIHLHNLHGYYINIEILFDFLKREYKGHVVWTLHDCWAFTGHCTYYSYSMCEKWKTECSRCTEKNRYPSSLLIDSSRRNFLEKRKIFSNVPNLTVVTVSKWLKEQTEKSFLEKYEIISIYNGIDTTVFRPLKSDIRERLKIGSQKTILCVSDGWDKRKGIDRLQAIIACAPSEWRFVIVGLTKKQIASLPTNAIGIERTWDQQELVKLYTAADVFYNPSTEETFGLVTAEALACGTPVVVYNTTACPELVQDETCGQVVNMSATHEESIAAIEMAMQKKTAESKKTFLLEDSVGGNIALYRACVTKKEDR